MDKTSELFGLHKIPDKILIKKLLEERGKLLSYIEELEDELGKSGGCTKCRVKAERIKTLEEKVRKLSAKQEVRDGTFESLYYTLLRKHEVMEKQMFSMAKSAYANKNKNKKP